jgi:hypothetical protein
LDPGKSGTENPEDELLVPTEAAGFIKNVFIERIKLDLSKIK